jgi:hypothetical protein
MPSGSWDKEILMKRKLGLAALLALGLAFVGIWRSGAFGPSPSKGQLSVGAAVVQGLVPSAFADPPIPDCPATFAVCDDTFGRNCNFSTMCTITDTGDRKCKKPDGSTFQCSGGQKIQIQHCPCREVFHNTCCDDDTCGPCPTCEAQPGSQTYFCL